MRVIVEIPLGRERGTKVVLDAGATLKVGRGDRRAFSGEPDAAQAHKHLVIEHDRQMAVAHFELSWDGRACLLEPVTEGAPTLLNGQAVRGGGHDGGHPHPLGHDGGHPHPLEVRHGDWIRAGETIFMVYREEHTPPRRGSGAGMTPAREAALSALMPLRGLYAVLDAARDPRILEVLHESVEQHASLYEGTKGDALAEKAPYLAALPAGSRLLRRLVEEGWGRRWGIYLATDRPFAELRTHLRRFLMVESDAGKRLYFRYYDPATLRAFLPSCTPRQAAELFGPIRVFVAESATGEVLQFDAAAAAAAEERRAR